MPRPTPPNHPSHAHRAPPRNPPPPRTRRSHRHDPRGLLDAIGPTRTSLPSIQRALDDLRSDAYEAQIVYDAKTRRWRLIARVPLPLHAPDHDDVLAVLIALAILEPLVDAGLLERLTKLVEDLDELARARTSSTNLPTRKSMTSTLTLGTRIDPAILRAILTACRREAIRIRYTSPWQPPSDDASWRVDSFRFSTASSRSGPASSTMKSSRSWPTSHG